MQVAKEEWISSPTFAVQMEWQRWIHGLHRRKNLTNIDSKTKLKSETWRIFGQALQKHILTHVGGSLSSRSKGENRNFPGPGEQSVLAVFEGIGKMHHEEPDKFHRTTEVAS